MMIQCNYNFNTIVNQSKKNKHVEGTQFMPAKKALNKLAYLARLEENANDTF